MTPSLAIVVPTLNAAKSLSVLLPMLRSDILDVDVMVADGGSLDDTIDVSGRHGARVTEAGGGRGPQMREGADAALGDWLLFLHADSRPPSNWDRLVADHMTDPANETRAAYFHFALDDTGPEARRLERLVAWRCRTFGLPYGDQGLLIARTFLDRLGGMPALPLMEDVALVRRIGKARLTALNAPLETSSRRFRHDGYAWRSAKNLFCLFLYFAGLPPAAIRKVYG